MLPIALCIIHTYTTHGVYVRGLHGSHGEGIILAGIILHLIQAAHRSSNKLGNLTCL